MLRIHLLLCCLLVACKFIEASKWEYKGANGPHDWDSIAPACGSSSQSPINIDTGIVIPNENLHFIEYQGYNQSLNGGNFINNGHTVQLNFPQNKVFKLSGNGFEATYTALQLHFHWRAKNSSIDGGSEHAINGEFYDAELHIVHIKDPYTSLDQIKNQTDGLAVIGVLLKVSDAAQDNPDYQNLLETAVLCTNNGETADLTSDVVPISLLPTCGSYFRYSGSLTTPPCYEAVEWTVYQNPVIISLHQLELLQSLRVNLAPTNNPSQGDTSSNHDNDEEELSDNFRPLQPLNGRIVTAFYDVDVETLPGVGWHYHEDEEDHWSHTDEDCGKSSQSPIDFKPDDISTSDQLNKLEFSSSYSSATSGDLANNGHTVVYAMHQHLSFEDGKKKFVAKQLHFHWGSASVEDDQVVWNRGSEHSVNGLHYPIEMHIVHAKENPEENGDDTSDDLAVLGVFFHISDDPSKVTEESDEQLEKLTEHFIHVHFEDDDVEIDEGPDLMDLLPSNKSYYRYYGSLTTPPCTESVMWTMFMQPVYVSLERFLQFQTLLKIHQQEMKEGNRTIAKHPSTLTMENEMKSASLANNYRPVQPLSGRTVIVYVQPPASTETNVLAIVLWTTLGLVAFIAILAAIILCRNKRSDKKVKYSEGKLAEESLA